jgi:hypothetical protein
LKKKKPKPRYGLIPAANHKKVRDFIDFDYVSKLSSEEADWLNKFSTEFYGATFNNNETDLHQTVIKRRKIYNENNARERDVYNKTILVNVDDFTQKEDEEDK